MPRGLPNRKKATTGAPSHSIVRKRSGPVLRYIRVNQEEQKNYLGPPRATLGRRFIRKCVAYSCDLLLNRKPCALRRCLKTD